MGQKASREVSGIKWWEAESEWEQKAEEKMRGETMVMCYIEIEARRRRMICETEFGTTAPLPAQSIAY